MEGAGTTCVGAQWAPGTITVAEDDGIAVSAPSAAGFEGLDDRAVVAACQAGQREAFDQIVARHRRLVYQVCYRFVGNHEDATDLAQEVFLRAYRALGRFKGDASVGTWLYRIAVNLCLNKVSSRAPRTESIDERHALPAHEPDAVSQLMRAERAGQVRAAIAKLPRKQRATLILRVYRELSHQEIAQVLGNSVGAVKANFFHALSNLRRLLREESR
jgi:RNA polymerase sigma-70 factor (ECF subfamily)